MSKKDIDKLKANLKKIAIDKLSDDELQSPLDSMQQDPSAMMPPPPMDPSMMEPPKPKIWNNKYLVNCDKTEFIVELTPSIVTEPPPSDPASLPQAQGDPMADTTLNPNADPAQLQQWMQDSDPKNEKPYNHNEEGTVDPLSQEEEGIEDTGNEQSVKVHNKKKTALLKKADDNQAGQNEAPIPMTPGADRSNAYPPCKYCANFNAADNTCSQGLDVEKVQAAKSCSWLNSNMTPFNGEKDPDASHKDKDTVKNDVSELSGGGEGSKGGSGGNMTTQANLKYNKKDKKLKSYLDKIWE
jgi:hypothetical protein